MLSDYRYLADFYFISIACHYTGWFEKVSYRTVLANKQILVSLNRVKCARKFFLLASLMSKAASVIQERWLRISHAFLKRCILSYWGDIEILCHPSYLLVNSCSQYMLSACNLQLHREY